LIHGVKRKTQKIGRRPKKSQAVAAPRLYFAVCVPTKKGAAVDWHVQKFDGLFLQTEGCASVGIDGRKFQAKPNSLCLVRKGTRRGFWNRQGQTPPKLWVVGFHCPDAFYDFLPHLDHDDPQKLVWKLTAQQAAIFKAYFIQLVSAQPKEHTVQKVRLSAWLKLLLGTVEQWASKSAEKTMPPERVAADVVALWERINANLVSTAEFRNFRNEFQNYNVLERRFRKLFGGSPQEVHGILRISHAKRLLLDSSLSIKKIARRMGYENQQEFARAFRRHVGVSPGQWRIRPTDGDLKAS